MKYISKILEISLYLLAFLLTLQTRLIIRPGELSGGYFEYGTISLYATDIITALVFLIAAIILIITARRVWRAGSIWKQIFAGRWTLVILPILLLVFSSISVLQASDKLLSAYKLVWLLAGVLLFWILIFARYDRFKLLLSFGLGLLVQAMLGIWQFITQSSFSSKWLGMALHDAKELGTSVIEIAIPGELPERWLRAYGGLDHPNILGGASAIGCLLLIAIIIKRTDKSAGPGGRRAVSLLIGLYLIIFAGLFTSFSRAAWVGFTIGFIIIFFLAVRSKALIKKREILNITLYSGILFFLLFSLYQDLALTRLKGSARLESKSTEERAASLKDGLAAVKANPLAGAGLGNYTLYGFNSASPDDPFKKEMYSYRWQPVHSAYLLIASEIGLPGLAVIICLMAVIFWQAAKNDKLMVPAAVCLAMLLAFDHWLWSLHFGAVFLWFAFGIIAADSKPTVHKFLE